MKPNQSGRSFDDILSAERFSKCRITPVEHAEIASRLEERHRAVRVKEIDSIARSLKPFADRKVRKEQRTDPQSAGIPLVVYSAALAFPQSSLQGIRILPAGCIGTYELHPEFDYGYPAELFEQRDQPTATLVTKVAHASRETRTLSLGVAVSKERPGSETWPFGDMNSVQAGFGHEVILPGTLVEPTLVTVDAEMETPGEFPYILDHPARDVHNGVLLGNAYLDLSAPNAVEQIAPLIRERFFYAWDMNGTTSYSVGASLERQTLTLSQTIYLLPGAASFYVGVGAELDAFRVGEDGLAWLDYAEEGGMLGIWGTRTHIRFSKLTLTFCRYKYFPASR
jgi:hypothetical protein